MISVVVFLAIKILHCTLQFNINVTLNIKKIISVWYRITNLKGQIRTKILFENYHINE